MIADDFITHSSLYVIKYDFGLDLPKSHKNLGYHYDFKNSPLQIKLSIEKEDIAGIKKCLENYEEATRDIKLVELPEMITSLSWWDFDAEKVDQCYMQHILKRSGFSFSMRQTWVFISKEIEGEYYLYLLLC